MKKLALALMAISASIFGLSAVANAYPPAGGGGVFSTITPVVNAKFTYTTPCDPSEQAVQSAFRDTFADALGVSKDWIAPGIPDATCDTSTGAASMLMAAPATGTAVIELTAPSEPGTYTVDYSGAATGSFSFTVTAPATPAAPGGGLPDTGSNGTGTMTLMGIGFFAVGAGLFGVSQVRRRSTVAA